MDFRVDLPRKGDRVRIRDCSVVAIGVVVDEISTDFVSVQWEDLPAPVTYRRSSLERLHADLR